MSSGSGFESVLLCTAEQSRCQKDEIIVALLVGMRRFSGAVFIAGFCLYVSFFLPPFRRDIQNLSRHLLV
jgi:hypothetical protein